MSRFHDPQIYDRSPGAAPHAAEDGLRSMGIYSATVMFPPSNSTVRVVISALDTQHTYTAVCSPAYQASPGDAVLVAFDERKVPWVVTPASVVMPPGVTSVTMGGDLSGSSSNATVQTWGGQSKAQVVAGNPPKAHASSHAAGGSDPVTPAAIGALAASNNLGDVPNHNQAALNLGVCQNPLGVGVWSIVGDPCVVYAAGDSAANAMVANTLYNPFDLTGATVGDDPGGRWDAVNKVYVCRNNGVFLCSIAVAVPASSDNGELGVGVRNDQSNYTLGTVICTGATIGMTGNTMTCMIPASAGQWLRPLCESNWTNSIHASGFGSLGVGTHFSVVQVM